MKDNKKRAIRDTRKLMNKAIRNYNATEDAEYLAQIDALDDALFLAYDVTRKHF